MENEEELKTYKQWSIGDVIWFNVHSEKRPHRGEIRIFHPYDKTAPSVTVYDLDNDIWRAVPVEFIFDNKKQAKEARQDYLNFIESIRNDYGS